MAIPLWRQAKNIGTMLQLEFPERFPANADLSDEYPRYGEACKILKKGKGRQLTDSSEGCDGQKKIKPMYFEGDIQELMGELFPDLWKYYKDCQNQLEKETRAATAAKR